MIQENNGRLGEIDQLLREHRVTAYAFGHDHELQYTTWNSTSYILSGAGSHQSTWREFIEDRGDTKLLFGKPATLGFAKGSISQNGFTVEYFDEKSTSLFRSEILQKRV